MLNIRRLSPIIALRHNQAERNRVPLTQRHVDYLASGETIGRAMRKTTRPVEPVRYVPIGVIHSPLKEPAGAPIQSVSAKHVKGTVEVYPPYVNGLADLAGFSYLILVYHFHLARKCTSMMVEPYLDNQIHGVFSTRAPARPNPIGISAVRLESIKGGTLYVRDLDVVDGTPLLDIKPYVPKFDTRLAQRIGWYAGRTSGLRRAKADHRFTR